MLIGILGGLGPRASAYFYERITTLCVASCDQEHPDLLISSCASTPDRTAYLLGKSEHSPLPTMLKEAERLCRAGVDVLAIPCNTAHSFYAHIASAVRVPVLNIVAETIKEAKACGFQRVAVLATEGTVKAGTYDRFCREAGIEVVYPKEATQKQLTSLIYQHVKEGKPKDERVASEALQAIILEQQNAGAQGVILGCTELSLVYLHLSQTTRVIDSTDALARAVLRFAGKEVRACLVVEA